MKKIILIVVFILVVSQISTAQVNFGIKGGLNISSLFAKQGDEQLKPLIGGNIGLFNNIKISNNLAFQPEIVFSSEGARISLADLDGSTRSGRFVFNYVNIPLLLKFAKSSTGIYGELGPQIGILASAKIASLGESQDIKDELKSINFSLALGLGYNFSESLGLSVRYNAGLSNILMDKTSYLKSSTLMIDLHYTLHKKSK
jgi:hypothetical protein